MGERAALIGSGSPLLALGLALVRKDAEVTGIWAHERARAQKSTLALGCPAFAQAADALRDASVAISDLPYEELRAVAGSSGIIAAVLRNSPQERDFLGIEAEISPVSDTLPCRNFPCQTKKESEEAMSDSRNDEMSDTLCPPETQSLQNVTLETGLPPKAQLSELWHDKNIYGDIFSDEPGGDWENTGRLALRLILDGNAPERVWGALRLRGNADAVGRLSQLFLEAGFEVHAEG